LPHRQNSRSGAEYESVGVQRKRPCRIENRGLRLGRGGFSSQTDEYILDKHGLSVKAQQCGSDLRAVTPREMLGLFLGCRARHLENTNWVAEAEQDYLLARYLFPRNRQLYIAQNEVSIHCSTDLFEPHEKGHPVELALLLRQLVQIAPWTRKQTQKAHKPKEKPNGEYIDAVFQQIIIGGPTG